jgi:hypothetical protein
MARKRFTFFRPNPGSIFETSASEVAAKSEAVYYPIGGSKIPFIAVNVKAQSASNLAKMG